ncbi:MAG: hypothetical protein KIT18_03750 [Burkholderiales bacterium]|nr:hypothetical protein [Burkholderiales bacterium]
MSRQTAQTLKEIFGGLVVYFCRINVADDVDEQVQCGNVLLLGFFGPTRILRFELNVFVSQGTELCSGVCRGVRSCSIPLREQSALELVVAFKAGFLYLQQSDVGFDEFPGKGLALSCVQFQVLGFFDAGEVIAHESEIVLPQGVPVVVQYVTEAGLCSLQVTGGASTT